MSNQKTSDLFLHILNNNHFFYSPKYSSVSYVMKPKSQAKIQTRWTKHIVIFADESFQSKNHLSLDSVRCYSKNKSHQFHLFGLNETANCNHSYVYHRRHCLLAEFMRTRVYTIYIRNSELHNRLQLQTG